VGRGDELDRALAGIEAGAPARDLESGTLEFKEQAKSHDKAISDVVLKLKITVSAVRVWPWPLAESAAYTLVPFPASVSG